MLKAIQTAAMEMLGGSGVEKQCRKVDIVADAAYAILSKPVSYTGHFFIDEDILRKEGIKDFDVYAVQPGERCTDAATCFKIDLYAAQIDVELFVCLFFLSLRSSTAS